MSALAVGIVVAGLAGLVGFIFGALGKAKRVVAKSPFLKEGELPPSVAYMGARQVLEYATERGEDIQYLRAKAALERYKTDKEVNMTIH